MPTINEKTKNLYIAINNVVSEIGKEGQIDSRHKLTEELMHALFYIDGGEYKPELLDTPDAALTKDAEPVDIGYMQKVSEALYENGDPVSIDAAELLERISAPAPKAITASNVDADIEYWRQKYLKLDAMYDELEKEKIAIEQNLMDRT